MMINRLNMMTITVLLTGCAAASDAPRFTGSRDYQGGILQFEYDTASPTTAWESAGRSEEMDASTTTHQDRPTKRLDAAALSRYVAEALRGASVTGDPPAGDEQRGNVATGVILSQFPPLNVNTRDKSLPADQGRNEIGSSGGSAGVAAPASGFEIAPKLQRTPVAAKRVDTSISRATPHVLYGRIVLAPAVTATGVTVFFPLGSSRLMPPERDALLAAAPALAQAIEAGKSVEVLGMTDSSGPEWTNRRLARRRAGEVMKTLRNYGIRTTRLTLSTDTNGAMQTNRQEIEETSGAQMRRVQVTING
ncbi:OmpA family protein [Burkholderia sp. MBR-1]|uniref:OmpA family protein n=1 Tax=Burkholderia sp. MBR-1 TaxID=2732364 RepID=UPI00215D6BD4|nr:OmpA family protein [Burkholderia sp. MBR-1]